jgi:hypothetical protein
MHDAPNRAAEEKRISAAKAAGATVPQYLAPSNSLPSTYPPVLSLDPRNFNPSLGEGFGWTGDGFNIANTALDYYAYGFNVGRIGNTGQISNTYAYVNGARSPAAVRAGITGTRYTLNNPVVASYVNPGAAARAALNPRTFGGAMGYVGVLLNVGGNVYDNIQNGASAQKIVVDVVVDTGFGIGGIAASAAVGAAVGSVVPGPGNVVGAVAGFVVGVGIYVFTDVVQWNGKSVTEWAKYGLGLLFGA